MATAHGPLSTLPPMYTAQGHIEQNTLFHQHLPLVRRIAQHMRAKLPPNVDLDDLIQAGMLGLHDALSRYQSDQGVQFESFASQRIRGAMLDELRAGDWASRNARKSQKDIERALHRLEQQLGRSPAESEIAAELGMPLSDYQSLLAKVQGTQLLYLEDLQASHPGSSEAEGESFLDRHMADHGSNPMQLLREQRLRSKMREH